MCRYVAYLGEPLLLADLVYEPANSLVHQASEAMESRTRINADGFGIGWYHGNDDQEAAVFKDVSPAWNNLNLRSLAGVVRSSCILAHVRAAQSFDPVSRANCHPFQYGRLLWMQNGDIPGRGRLHRRVACRVSDELVARINGNTDTELAFALFLELLGESRDRPCSADELADAMARTVEQIRAWWRIDRDDRPLILNFCVADGRSLIGLRYGLATPEVPTLHYSEGSRFVCRDGVCRMRDEGGGRCVVLASEVLSDDDSWRTVKNGTLIVVNGGDPVAVRSLAA